MNIVSVLLLFWICYSSTYTVTGIVKNVRNKFKEEREKTLAFEKANNEEKY